MFVGHVCLFVSYFSNWLCGGGLQHMSNECFLMLFLMLLWVELSQPLYKTCMGLYVALGEKLSDKHRYTLAKVLCVLTAPATLTHISDSAIAEGRYSQQTEWKTYWQLANVILQNAYACNGALDDIPQSNDTLYGLDDRKDLFKCVRVLQTWHDMSKPVCVGEKNNTA